MTLAHESRRRPTTVGRMVGLSLVVVAAGQLVSAAVNAVDGDDGTAGLLASAAVVGAAGTAVLVSTRLPDRQLPTATFAAVTWAWLAASLAGALPFLLTGAIGWSHADDALFESVSGFTCTGATILPDIEALPAGLLFFRSTTQWFGGMGLIVLAVAVLPAMKVGGLELIAAEAPGPSADRLTPRIRETAQRLWILYAGITIAVAAAMVIVGESLYDGVTHSMTTVSTGGFSPYNDSIAHFDSLAVEIILVAGMIYCGANFSLHWQAVTGDWRTYWRVSEVRTYVAVLVGGAVVLAAAVGSVRDAAFNITTIVTSTGFATSDFTLWSSGPQLLLLLLMVPAGMTGSTSGGIKLMRAQVVVRAAIREVVRSRHPRALLPLRLGSTTVTEDIVARVIGFVLIYIGMLVAGGLAVTALGATALEGFSGAVSAIGNIGPALGTAGPKGNWLVFPRESRPVLMALMLFGRLEIYPMLLTLIAAVQLRSFKRVVTPLHPRARPRA